MDEVVKAEKNYNIELLKKALNIIDLSLGEIGENYLLLSELNFKPVLNIGGYKFSFDENDPDINYLFGGNGKKYEMPFEITDEAKTLNISKIGDRSIFKVRNKCILQIDDEEKKYYLGLHNNDFSISMELKKDSDYEYEVIFNLYKDYGINNDTRVEIKYQYDWHLGRVIFMSHEKRDIPNDLHESTSIRTREKLGGINRLHPERKEGQFWAHYYTGDSSEDFNRTDLIGPEQVDLYFEDVCANAKEFVNLIKNHLESYDRELLELFLGKCPEIKDIMDTILESENKGVVGSIVKNYFVKKKSLNMEDTKKINS